MIDQEKPLSPWEKMRRVLLGKPIPTSKAHHERLSPLIGLPVFSSDALSSVAYATEAILGILILFSVQALHVQIWVTLSIGALIVIIGLSYTQTIRAYPMGGGSYIVASENLGEKPGLVGAGSLLIDYILTVSVSIAAGVAALTSAVPTLHPYLVPLSLLFMGIIAWANLRGVRESGVVFAVPTYLFITLTITMIGIAIYKIATGAGAATPQVLADPKKLGSEVQFGMLFIVLRAFAAGCTALTGIEAVSDGVQAFRAPEAKNASLTLKWMTVILLTMFIGIGYVCQHLPTLSFWATADPRYRTVMSQIGAFAFGENTWLYYLIQISTTLILILAANTAFADFPRLASFLARDGYLPRPLARQGDRLVFHNGIIFLAVSAAALVVYFRGELEHLLPLYAVGVFTAFTLSQAGMVMHWWRHRGSNWKTSISINIAGTFLSFCVLLIILITKFTEGAWIVAVIIAIVYAVFKSIKNRYAAITKQLAIGEMPIVVPKSHVALLLVPRVHRGLIKALSYAKQLKGDCQAVHVILNEKNVATVRRDWERYGQDVPLVVLSSPYRSLIGPLLEYVDELIAEDPDRGVTVIVAEAVSSKWAHKLLQENVAQQLKNSLAKRRNVVIASVRYFLN